MKFYIIKVNGNYGLRVRIRPMERIIASGEFDNTQHDSLERELEKLGFISTTNGLMRLGDTNHSKQRIQYLHKVSCNGLNLIVVSEYILQEEYSVVDSMPLYEHKDIISISEHPDHTIYHVRARDFKEAKFNIFYDARRESFSIYYKLGYRLLNIMGKNDLPRAVKSSHSADNEMPSATVVMNNSSEKWYVYLIRSEKMNFMMVSDDNTLEYTRYNATFTSRVSALAFIQPYTTKAVGQSDVYLVVPTIVAKFDKCTCITYTKRKDLVFHYKPGLDISSELISGESIEVLESINIYPYEGSDNEHLDMLRIASVFVGERMDNIEQVLNSKISWHVKQALNIMYKNYLSIDDIVLRIYPKSLRIASNNNNFLTNMVNVCPCEYTNNEPNVKEFKEWIYNKYEECFIINEEACDTTNSDEIEEMSMCLSEAFDIRDAMCDENSPIEVEERDNDTEAFNDWLNSLPIPNSLFVGVRRNNDFDMFTIDGLASYFYEEYKNLCFSDIDRVIVIHYDLERMLSSYTRGIDTITMILNALFEERKRLL